MTYTPPPPAVPDDQVGQLLLDGYHRVYEYCSLDGRRVVYAKETAQPGVWQLVPCGHTAAFVVRPESQR